MANIITRYFCTTPFIPKPFKCEHYYVSVNDNSYGILARPIIPTKSCRGCGKSGSFWCRMHCVLKHQSTIGYMGSDGAVTQVTDICETCSQIYKGVCYFCLLEREQKTRMYIKRKILLEASSLPEAVASLITQFVPGIEPYTDLPGSYRKSAQIDYFMEYYRKWSIPHAFRTPDVDDGLRALIERYEKLCL